jgi:hypothetical protein
MKVVFYDKKTETYEHVDNVRAIQQKQEVIGFSDTKFRYIWLLILKAGPYEKSYPCNRYTIHTIVE